MKRIDALWKYMCCALMCLTILSVATATPDVIWEFDTPTAPGVAPSGWSDGSQSISPFPIPTDAYSATTFMSVGVMRFRTEANKLQRPKLMTQTVYKEGVYEWRVYIPTFEAGARCSIGAFLYSPQSSDNSNSREIDFEIGYGRADVRTYLSIPEDRLICLMTIQPDDSSGTIFNIEAFTPADPSNHIEPNNWYTLTVELNEDTAGRYVVSWFIQKDGGPRLNGRSDFTCEYGPNNAFPTDFRIFCSLENLDFMGEFTPTVDHVTYFDRVSFSNRIMQIDPSGGFVTGNGWIDSPAGAYRVAPTLTGKAKFGFVSKYKKGAEVPKGKTQFNLRVADLNFRSASYRWLAIANHKAMCKGDGTINGEGSYGFILSAIDAKLTPGTNVVVAELRLVWLST
ncbi:hypothetical protein ACFL6S_13060 [Candidatus Poribacteria bacterium]